MCLSGEPCSQEPAHGAGSAVREVQLWACPCSLCVLLHSLAFRASWSSVERAAPAPHACGAAGISAAGSPCPPSERRFPGGQEDTDGALCSREAAHGAQSHSPALPGGLPAWLGVPRAVRAAQLRDGGIGSPAPHQSSFSSVPLQVLWENESLVLKLPFSKVFQLCHLPGLAAASPGVRLVRQPWLAVGCAAAWQVTEL